MCGFLVRLSDGGVRPIDAGAVRSIGPRGPDEEWSYCDRAIAAHAFRLALERPDISYDELVRQQEDLVVLLNGEIWNYTELAADMQMAQDVSEYTVIAELFRRQGVLGLSLLEGMFAVAVVEVTAQRVHAARDRMGIKPLFYCVDPLGATLGSTVEGVARASGVPVVGNAEYLADLDVFGFSLGWATAIGGVDQLPPGHYLSISLEGGGTLLGELELPPMPQRSRLATHVYDRASGEHDRALADAVGRCLRLPDDEEVALLLSGGVDSSLLACHVVAQRPRSSVVCVYAGSASHPDASHAASVARELGLRLEIVGAPLNLPLPDARCGGYRAQALGALFAEIRRRMPAIRVVICGEGADEVHRGYDWYQDPLARARQWAARASALGTAARTRRVAEEIAALDDQSCLLAVHSLDLTYGLVDRHLIPFDIASGQHGMEVRVPYLDESYLRVVHEIPESVRFASASPKPLVRKDLLRRLPIGAWEIVARRKESLPSAIVPLVVADVAATPSLGGSSRAVTSALRFVESLRKDPA